MYDSQVNQYQQNQPIQEQQQTIQQQNMQPCQVIQTNEGSQNQPFPHSPITQPAQPLQQPEEKGIQPTQQIQQPYQQYQQQIFQPLQQIPPQNQLTQEQQPEQQQDQQQTQPQKKAYKLKLKFEELGVYRRAALGLLPNVNDPELQEPMSFSTLKSSRKYKFLDPDKLSVTLEGGYRLCRSTRFLPVDKNYYWEVDFTSAKNQESHVRIGIATINADMEVPVGVDEEGYCVADLGKSLHNGWKNKKVKTPPFYPSDVIGLGFMPGPESISLKLFINGIDHGIIYDGINKDLKWTPSVSIYRDAVVTGRFFRPFKFDPGNDWAAAGDIPRDTPSLPITAKDLVKVMKGTMAIAGESDLYMAAIYSALTPAHQMPI